MKTLSILLAVVFYTTSLTAQPGSNAPGGNCSIQGQFKKGKGIPGLTEEQSKKIDALRISFQKEMLPLRNQMGELKARQKTLGMTEKADMKAINANIDEITKLQNQMMKKSAEHRQQVRSLLTDEQRLWFDTKKQGRKGEFRKGNRMKPNGSCNNENIRAKRGFGPNAK